MGADGAANGAANGGASRGKAAAAAARARPERSGKGPGASLALLALTLLTPVAILALGLACGDPAVSPLAQRARERLGAERHLRLSRAVASAAPDLLPASATLAAWAAEGARRAAPRARALLGAVAGLPPGAGAKAGAGGGGNAPAPAATGAPTCQLSGSVDAECCHCTYADVQQLNAAHVAPLVSELVKTAFFRYFKVNIACDCPLWPDDSMCALKACSVCQCGDDEVPAPWLAAERGGGGGNKTPAATAAAAASGSPSCAGAADPGCSTADCALEESGRVDTRLDARVESRLRHVRGWRGVDNPWIFNATEEARARKQRARALGAFGGAAASGLGAGGGGGGAAAKKPPSSKGGLNQGEHADDDDDDGDEEEQYQYINLLANPERYTGYKGEHAHRIWAAIYGQSCFASPGGPSLLKKELERCTEKRVFYRLISGMHASISAHLVGDWLLDEERGEWGANLTEFRRRFVDEPEAAERVANLYFAYLFVLRAVTKAAPLLADPAQYDTGLPEEDARTRELVAAMLGRDGAAEALRGACPLPFDEGRLWRGEEGPELRRQLQSAFQNITRVMDCVGCEKCKLWGKLQTLGVATALKILFSEEDCEGNPGAPLRLAAGGSGGGAGGSGGGSGGADGSGGVAGGSDSEDDYADGYDDEPAAAAVAAAVAGAAAGEGAAVGAAATTKRQAAMTLERNEVIALVNLLGRFSNSLRLYHELLRRVADADSTVASDAGTVLA